MTSPSPAIQAARHRAAGYLVPSPGAIRLAGETRQAYLQRQTTNNLDLLNPRQAVPSLLTSAQGRVLEAFTLLEEDEAILMLTQPGHGPGLAAYFQKRVFFNDQVTVTDESDHWAQLEIVGPEAPQALAALGFTQPPAANQVAAVEWQGASLSAIGLPHVLGNPRFLLLSQSSTTDQSTTRLIDTLTLPLLDNASRDLLRIQSGQAGDPEIDARQYTPYELGLGERVSAEKGCYTGQEVLARQVTYDKIVRHLVRLSSQQPLAPGNPLQADGKAAGEVTSAADSPNGPLALAVVRRPYDASGTQLTAQADGAEVSATVL